MTEKHMHWSERLAERVIAEKKEPYSITSGMTTSGPAHFGTVCEFLFPYTVGQMLERKGRKYEFYLIGDIIDAFDKIPIPMEKYRAELEQHMGKPLSSVPDPTGMSKSFGDHFLNEVKELMKKLNVKCNVLRSTDLYSQGRFDEWARFYLKHESQAKEIIERTSGRQVPKDFSVIMPICEKCGKIATTAVTKHDDESYEYTCNKDVKYTKGCGHSGKNKINDHKWKLVWRLHWPAWKQISRSSIEGAGVDHSTKGGSEDTCTAITTELMKKEHAIPFAFGFILLEGKKYSKSKGLGLGVNELLNLIPAEILKYLLLRPDLEENIDINPTSENLLKAIEDFQNAASLDFTKIDQMSRSDRKRAIAFSLSTEKMRWKVPFLDALLYYQIYHTWDDVVRLSEDSEGVAYLRPYIEEWIARDFIPEEYRFKYQPGKPTENVKKFISILKADMDALGIHNAVFEFAKTNSIEPKGLFAELYQTLLGKERGPRLGKLIAALGVERVKKDLAV